MNETFGFCNNKSPERCICTAPGFLHSDPEKEIATMI